MTVLAITVGHKGSSPGTGKRAKRLRPNVLWRCETLASLVFSCPYYGLIWVWSQCRQTK